MTDPMSRLSVALDGRYRVERKLGEGGMATVYLAHDLRHERRVAIKIKKAVLGRIITEPAPRIRTDRPTVPPNVEAAILRALEKVPVDRFASGAEFARALADPAFRHGPDAGINGNGRLAFWRRVAAVAALIAAGAAGTTAWALTRATPLSSSVMVARFESPFREGQGPINRAFAPIPDGAGIVYQGLSADSQSVQLWVRRWPDPEAARIPSTDDAGGVPAVSPDGNEVAYPTGNPGELRVRPVAGGTSRTLVDACTVHSRDPKTAGSTSVRRRTHSRECVRPAAPRRT